MHFQLAAPSAGPEFVQFDAARSSGDAPTLQRRHRQKTLRFLEKLPTMQGIDAWLKLARDAQISDGEVAAGAEKMLHAHGRTLQIDVERRLRELLLQEAKTDPDRGIPTRGGAHRNPFHNEGIIPGGEVDYGCRDLGGDRFAA